MGAIILWLVIILAIIWTINWILYHGMSRGHFWAIVDVVFLWILISYFLSYPNISRFHLLWATPVTYALSIFLSGIFMRTEVNRRQDFKKPIELTHKNSETYWKSGELKFDMKDYFGALQDFNKVIELSPKNSIAYDGRGWAKYCMEDYFGAIQDFNKVIELHPTNASAYEGRGLSKIFTGDKHGGCLDISKSGEHGSKRAHEHIQRYCQQI